MASNIPITTEARTAVSRLTNNQEKRPLETFNILSVIFSSPTPPRNFISSPASSFITSTISSAVITPINLPFLSTTGAETRSNLSNSIATISLSKSELIVTKWFDLISCRFMSLSDLNKLDNNKAPCGLFAGSTR